MPSLFRNRPATPKNARRSLVAASSRVVHPQGGTIKNPELHKIVEWQQQAWTFYDLIGELRYGARYYGNSLSQMRLEMMWKQSSGSKPEPIDLENPPEGFDRRQYEIATEALNRLHAADGSVAEILRSFGVNMFIAGEGYLVGRTDPDTGLERWDFYSTEQLVFLNGNWFLKENVNWRINELVPITSEDYVIRVWNPHPRYSDEPDSPVRSILSLCEELLLLSANVRATALSRIPAGILLMPDTMLDAGPEIDPQNLNDDTRREQQSESTLEEIYQHFITPISDPNSAAAVAPFILTGDPEDLEQVRLIEFDREVDEIAAAQRKEILTRIAHGIDLPTEILNGMSSVNHWCVDDSTEILTRDRGWVTQTGLLVGDEVLTLNHETGLSQWQAVDDIYRADVVDEPMVLMEGRNHSSYTTPNHRWPVLRSRQKDFVPFVDRQIVTTQELTVADAIVTAAPNADLPTYAKYDDALVELVAWFWTEGSISNSGLVSISQSHTVNEQRVGRIRSALTDLFGGAVDKFAGVGRVAWREKVQTNESSFGGPITVFYLNRAASDVLIEAAPNKLVPADFVTALTRSQLVLFVDVSEQGDGQHYRQGRHDIWQKNPAALDGYELALQLLGHMTVRGPSDGGWRVSVWNQSSVRPVKAAAADGQMTIETVPYSGTLWCPVTANSTWFARRDGKTYFTGNTAWQIEESSYKAHIRPAISLFCSEITSSLVWPAVQIATGQQIDPRLVVGFDPIDLTSHIDRRMNAKDGHSALVISDSTYRRALGYTDDDAPGDDEYVRRMALHQNSLTMTPVAAGQEDDVKVALDEAVARTMPGMPTPESVIADRDPRGREAEPERAPSVDEPGDVVPDTPVTASAVVPDLGERLVGIDRVLMERLELLASAAMRRALEKAGARIRSRVSRDEDLKGMVAAASNFEVASVLGSELVASLYADESVLLSEAFDDFREQYDSLTRKAQKQVRDIVASYGLDPEDLEAMSRQQDLERDAGWLLLGALLVGVASKLLYRPKIGAEDVNGVDSGEFDDISLVPASVIRAGLSAAGGNMGISTAGGAVIDVADRPLGLLGTGETTNTYLAAAGADVVGYRWVYGPEMRATFEPHLDLDGYEFTSWEDGGLVNGDAFPAAAYFYPGDHDGCRCLVEYLYAV